jgi:hypothetical protein
MRDGVVTHNHPDDGVPPDRQQYNPPSDADLLVAVIADAQAVRAVTPQGVVYQIGRPPDGWPFAGAGGGITQARAVRSRLRTALESARRHPDVAGEVARAIAAGEVSPAGSYLLLQHLALARLAKLGRISYTVGRYAT